MCWDIDASFPRKSGEFLSSKCVYKNLISLPRVKSVIVSKIFLKRQFGAIAFNTANILFPFHYIAPFFNHLFLVRETNKT